MDTWPSSLRGTEGQNEEWEETLSSRVGSRGVSDTQISHTIHIKESVKFIRIAFQQPFKILKF